uniref:PDZ domain-containing protein n=1 Tax=Oryza meridionalis TaxID=40149 RepID=A0A0E0E9A9_9ORYZ
MSSPSRSSVPLPLPDPSSRSETSAGGTSPRIGSVRSEGDAAPHRSEEKSEKQRPGRRKRKRGKRGPRRPTIALLTEEAKQRLLRVVTPTSPGTTVSPFAPAPRRPQYPPFPEDGNVEDVRKWNDECHEVSKIIKKIEKDFANPQFGCQGLGMGQPMGWFSPEQWAQASPRKAQLESNKTNSSSIERATAGEHERRRVASAAGRTAARPAWLLSHHFLPPNSTMSDQECMEANHRLEEKIDMILEKLNEVEANSSKFFKEMSASIKATVAVLKAAPYPPPQDPPSSTPTTCSTMCSNNDHPRATSSSSHIDKETAPTGCEDKVHDPCIVTKDFLEVTSTMCLMKCSSTDTKPDLTLVAVVMCATTATTSTELVVAEDTTGVAYIDTPDYSKMMHAKCSTAGLDVDGGTDQAVVVTDTKPDLTLVAVVMCATTATTSTELVVAEDTTGVAYIDTPDYSKMMHAKCSTAGLDVDGGTDQAVVVFPIIKSVSKVVPISVKPLGIFSLRLIANLKQDRPTPTKCSMKSPLHRIKVLLIVYDLYHNPWPPSICNEVTRGWDLQPMAGLEFKFYWARVHFISPWPPPTQISSLPCEPFDFGAQIIGTVILTNEMVELKPWSPPVQSKFSIVLTMDRLHIGWNLVNTDSKNVWGETMKLVPKRDKDIPIKTEPKDLYTTEAIQSSRDKVVVLHAARAIVSISHIMDDGQRQPQCTGIIIKQWSDDTGHHHATIVTYSRIVCEAGRKRDPLPKLSVCLPNKKTVLDAELIYFNDHYDIALLHINLEVTMELPSFGRGPEYGQEVFVLARDGEASLRARRGDIQWLEESDILGRDHYMFLSCDIPEGGNGGMVIDNDGVVRGMAIYCSPYPAVTSISTIVKCIDMFMQFKTIALLDVQLQEDISDFSIKGGFLVDRVYNPVAEDLGIKRGNVITSINGKGALTLPELEDYLLSLGWDYLEDKLNCIKDIKLRVCDLKSGVEIDVTLPVRFYDKSERSSLDVLLVFCHAADTSCKVVEIVVDLSFGLSIKRYNLVTQ